MELVDREAPSSGLAALVDAETVVSTQEAEAGLVVGEGLLGARISRLIEHHKRQAAEASPPVQVSPDGSLEVVSDDTIERLADAEHASWSRWMQYQFSQGVPCDDGCCVTIPPEKFERWKRQASTPYAELSEREKQSDRDEVIYILPIIGDAVRAAVQAALDDQPSIEEVARATDDIQERLAIQESLYDVIAESAAECEQAWGIDVPPDATLDDRVGAIFAMFVREHEASMRSTQLSIKVLGAIMDAVHAADRRLRSRTSTVGMDLPERVSSLFTAAIDRLEAVEADRDRDRLAVRQLVESLQREAGHFFGGTMADQIRSLVGFYQDVANETLSEAQSFRDAVLVKLEALNLVVDMVGAGNTHAEKNARLRGLSELLTGSTDALREMRFNLREGRWWPDPLGTHYAFKSVMRDKRHLEDQVVRLNAELREVRGEPTIGPAADADEAPLISLPF